MKHRIFQFGIWQVRHRELKLNSHHRRRRAMRWQSVRTQKYASHAAAMATLPFGIYTIKRLCDSSKDTPTAHPASTSAQMVLGSGLAVWITQFVHGTCARVVNCNSMISVRKSSHSDTVRLVCAFLNYQQR